VRRIEAFRQARETIDPAQDALLLPLEDAHSLRILTSFDFASDAEGRIVWAESPVAPMVVGHVLGAVDGPASAVKLHQPLRGLQVELKGAPPRRANGRWMRCRALIRWAGALWAIWGVSGARRKPPPPPRAADEADRLRQLLHELRTPVNAIQGFAEVIQQQLVRPRPARISRAGRHDRRRCRARAGRVRGAGPAGQAGQRHAGTGARRGRSGRDPVVHRRASATSPHQPGARLALAVPAAPVPLHLAPAEAERLVWRLLSTLCANAAPDEVLAVSLSGATLHLALPRALAALDDAGLYHAVGEGGRACSAPASRCGWPMPRRAPPGRAAPRRVCAGAGSARSTLPGLTMNAPDPSKGRRCDQILPWSERGLAGVRLDQ
jgi:hypothetical protein